VSWAAIAQIETGRRTDVRLSSLSALAGALGLSIDYLVGHPTRPAAPTLEHQTLVYRSATEFLSTVIPFLNTAIERSESALLVASPANAELVRDALGGDANRVEYRDSSFWYSSPVEVLGRYRSYLDERIAAGSTWARIVGEPVWEARSSGEIREWTRYESIINLTFANAPATILCTYDARSLPASVWPTPAAPTQPWRTPQAATPAPTIATPRNSSSLTNTPPRGQTDRAKAFTLQRALA